jgi:hypothetical protein
MKRLAYSVIAAALLIFGCGQNPMPQDGFVRPEPEDPKNPVVPPFVIDVPNSVSVNEGEDFKLALRVQVPSPGQPEVTAYDLPAGATFDPATYTVHWTPSFNAANDNRDPAVLVQVYKVKFVLRSSEDKVTTMTEYCDLIVHDTARDIRFVYSQPALEFTEGKLSKFQITVESDDLPAGPYTLNSDNLPPGATLTRVTGSKNSYWLTYQPEAMVVTVDDRPSPKGFFKTQTINLAAIGPTAQSKTDEKEITIYDKRIDPKVISPASVSVGLDGYFVFSAEDLNGEEIPSISIPDGAPFGALTSTTLQNTASATFPRLSLNYRWNNIPLDKIGTSHTFQVKSCVKKSYWDKTLCVNTPLKVNISGEALVQPTIDRSKFPLGMVKYVKVKDTLRIPLRIRDGAGGSIAKVEIEPASLASEVNWSSDEIVITPKNVGMQQFNLHATSSKGITKTEGFVFDALPWSWSPVVIVGDSASSPEVISTLALFDSAQLVNPDIQELTGKIIALRTTLVVTSSMMTEPSIVSQIEEAAPAFKNLVILTPLVDKFTGKIKTELTARGFSWEGRFKDLTDSPPALGEFNIETGTMLTEPTKNVTLGGKLTAESANPMMLKNTSGASSRMLSVESRSITHKYSVAYTCSRTGGGKLIVSGIEWGDLVTESVDDKIAHQWMNEVVTP